MPEQRNAQPPPLQPLGVDLFYDTFTGTYRLDPRNDLAVHAGVDALKKRIIRRILTFPGEFYHLPDYGVGVQTKKKFNATNLTRLQADVIRQVRQEDEVDEVGVNVANPSPGVLVIEIKARTISGLPFGLSMTFPDEELPIVGG